MLEKKIRVEKGANKRIGAGAKEGEDGKWGLCRCRCFRGGETNIKGIGVGAGKDGNKLFEGLTTGMEVLGYGLRTGKHMSC